MGCWWICWNYMAAKDSSATVELWLQSLVRRCMKMGERVEMMVNLIDWDGATMVVTSQKGYEGGGDGLSHTDKGNYES